MLSAIRERKKSFVFTDGTTVSLDPRVGYFITMNPGYGAAGRRLSAACFTRSLRAGAAQSLLRLPAILPCCFFHAAKRHALRAVNESPPPAASAAAGRQELPENLKVSGFKGFCCVPCQACLWRGLTQAARTHASPLALYCRRCSAE